MATKKQTAQNPLDTIVEGLTTTSSKIRALRAAGVSRGDVSRYLGIRYQHVRNVELQPLKKQG